MYIIVQDQDGKKISTIINLFLESQDQQGNTSIKREFQYSHTSLQREPKEGRLTTAQNQFRGKIIALHYWAHFPGKDIWKTNVHLHQNGVFKMLNVQISFKLIPCFN